MKDLEIHGNVTKPIRLLIIAMLSLAFIVALIPLWQIGVESTRAVSAVKAHEELSDLNAESRALRAAIAAGLPSADEDVVYRAGLAYR